MTFACRSRMAWRSSLLFTVALCAACASTGEQPSETEQGVQTAIDDTADGLGDAILTPLSDLNLIQDEIPEALREIRSPYDPISTTSCAGLGQLVLELDAVLGPDADAFIEDDEEGTGERVGEEVADTALGTVSGITGGFIPFRGLVRRATGATEREQEVRAAYQRGLARRAYLKGIGEEKGCPPPAAPRRSVS